MVNQLPQGWKEEELGKLADVSSGDSAPQSSSCFLNGSYPFCRTSDVGKIHRSSNFSEIEDYINETAISKLHLFHRGTILFPKSGASTLLNHRVMLSIDSYVSSHLATIYANSIDRYYLYYFLCTVDAKQLVPNLDYPSLKISELKNIKVPYPTDKGEQDYIVKTLDAVAEIIRLRKETIQLAKELIPTIFQEMFGDPERKICLADVATIKGGKRLPYGGQLQDETTVHPYIRVADMVNNTIKKDELKYISDVIYNKIQNYTISSRDVYISIAGTIGRVGLVPDNLEGANLTENAAKIVLNENKINKVFLVYVLLTDVLQSQIKSLTVQAGVPKLAISRIESLKIYCPPLSEQEEFADKVEQINKYIAAQQEELEQFETLFQSLLHEAFTGVLTWNYPRKECHDKKDK